MNNVERNKKLIIIFAIASIVLFFGGLSFMHTNYPLWGMISIVGVLLGGVAGILYTLNKKTNKNISLQETDKREETEESEDSQAYPSITIGRSHENDIIVDDPNVTRMHCKIERVGEDKYIITAYPTENGTFVNGEKLEGSMEITPSDDLRMGNTHVQWLYKFTGEDKDEPETAVAESEQEPTADIMSIKHTCLYRFEYKLFPLYVELIKEKNDLEPKLLLESEWKKDIVPIANPQFIDWDEVSCEIVGDKSSDYMYLLEFPTPFDMPLAKYGAVYINKQKQEYRYFTLELSLSNYVLGSMTTERHINYGGRGNLSKDEFIKEVCDIVGIDDISQMDWRLVKEKKSMDKRIYWKQKLAKMVELNGTTDLEGLEIITDNNYNEFISSNSRAVVCFYDEIDTGKRLTSGPCKHAIGDLVSLADEYIGKIKVGIYNVYGPENETVRDEKNIRVMPTFLFIKDGEEIDIAKGCFGKSILNDYFTKLLLAE